MARLNPDVEEYMKDEGCTEEEALNGLGLNWSDLWEDDSDASESNDS